MKPQYQTRYELLHESYQKWLTGFTRHAVSWGVCHPNIYYFHNLTPGWVSFNGEKPEIAIVPQSLHRLIYGPDKRATPPLDDDLIVNLCTSEHLLVHHPMLEGILLSECERLRQRSLANKLISLFRQFGGTELRLKLVWLCWLDLMTGNCLDDWTENLKRKSEKELEEWIINRQKQSAALTDLMDLNRPGFPGECFICEFRLPDHRFRWKHNKLFLLLPEEYGPAFPAIVDCYTSPPT